MGSAIGQVLPLAIGVAISPVPIIALILMLLSKSATKNSLAFALGWIFGLTVVGVVVLALGLGPTAVASRTPCAAVKVVIGLLLIGLAGESSGRAGRGRARSPRCRAGWLRSTRSALVGRSVWRSCCRR